MMQQNISTKQLLAEINMDLSVPLHIKLALKEFELDVRRVLQEQSLSTARTKTLLEFTHLTDVTALRNAFISLPTVDVNKVNVIAQAVDTDSVKSQVPSGLLKALSNMLSKMLQGGIEKLAPRTANAPQWIEKLRGKVDDATLYKLDRFFAIGGKVAALAVVVATPLVTLIGLPVPAWVVTSVAAGLIRLLADLAQGKKPSEAIAGTIKQIATGAAMAGAISYLSGSWPAIQEFITSNAARLGITDAQAQAVAQARSIDAITPDPLYGPGSPASGGIGSDAVAAGNAPQPSQTGGIGSDAVAAGNAPQPSQTGGIGSDAVAAPGGTDTGAGTVAGELQAAGRQVINIPQDSTLSQLAQQYKVSVDDLMQVNPQITDPNKIIAGAQLVIPPETGKPIYDRGVGLPRTR